MSWWYQPTWLTETKPPLKFGGDISAMYTGTCEFEV